MTNLSLHSCALYDEGLELLVTGLRLAAQTAIELERNPINSRGAYALAACVWLKRMEQLSLSPNPVGCNARLELLSSANEAMIELEEPYDDDL